MAFYAATKTLLNNRKHADLTLTCNGHQMPLHRAIVATQCAFFDPTGPGGEPLVDVTMHEPPRYVEKFITILYCGNYSDPIFGHNDEAHAMALVSHKDMKELLQAGFARDVTAVVQDKNDTNGMNKFHSSKTWAIEQDSSQLIQCPTDASCVYFLGDKYDLPTARIIAMYRLSLALDILLDVDDLEHDTILQFMGVVNQIYLWSRPDKVLKSSFRFTLCNALRSGNSRNKKLGDKIKKAASITVKNYQQFAEDMSRPY